MAWAPVALPPTSTVAAGSPDWWVARLATALAEDQDAMNLWWRYFVGDHPFPQAPDKVRDRVEESYSAILARSNANFMGTVVEAKSERCRPVGFRLGADRQFEDDLDTWRIWQASKMDADAPLAIETAFAKGRSYLSVWQYEGDEYPTIAVEDPSQCIVAHEPGRRHRRAAALKTYVDEWTGQQRADLLLPTVLNGQRQRVEGGIWRYVRSVGGGWTPMPGTDEYETNPFGYDGVPIVPLYNRPRLVVHKLTTLRYLKHGGDSDLSDVTAIQDRLNETILNRVIAQWFAAFKQKWVTGLNIDDEPVLDSDGDPVLDANGAPVTVPQQPFDVWLDRLLVVDNLDVKFGEFGATDLTGYLKSHERDLQDLSTIKRIPRHYLFQEGQSPSGDAIKSAETGLVAKVRRSQLDLGDPFEEAARIARLFHGEGEASPDSELIWADPEFQTYGQLVDGVLKEYQAGLVPWEGAMEKLGYSPQQIARYRGMRDFDTLLRVAETVEPAGEVAA
jgi:hypothetical protein